MYLGAASHSTGVPQGAGYTHQYSRPCSPRSGCEPNGGIAIALLAVVGVQNFGGGIGLELIIQYYLSKQYTIVSPILPCYLVIMQLRINDVMLPIN